MIRCSLYLIGCCLLLLGCAQPVTKRADISDALVAEEAEKQREIALKRHVELEKRLARVSYPLLKRSDALCEENWRAGTGLHLLSKYSYKGDFQETAARLFGLDRGVQVLYIVPESPASRAGFESGDRILQLNDFVVQPGKEALKELLGYYEEQIKPGQLLNTKVSRGGEILQLEMVSDTLCNYEVVLVESDAVNAFADGEHVGITRGMMRFTETDQELGLVVAHEIAHNAMGHVDAQRSNTMGGLLLDILAAAAGVNTQGLFSEMAGRAYSQEFEAEADYVGLYIMERAAQPIDGAADFWRRMAAEHPASIRSSHSVSHPSSAKRFVAIEQTISEIGHKRERGLQMLPELKAPAERVTEEYTPD